MNINVLQMANLEGLLLEFALLMNDKAVTCNITVIFMCFVFI